MLNLEKLLTILGAIALTFTLSMAEGGKCAEGKCGGDMNKTEKKCSANGKCASDKKDMKKKCANGKCGGTEKKAPTKGKCGQGKCG